MAEFPLQFTTGLDRSRNATQNELSSFWTMRGFRLSPTQPGVVEQLPYMYATTYPQGTYYTTTSATEPSTSAVIGASAECVWTDYVARQRSNGNQAQIFYQTFSSGGTPRSSIQAHCLLVITGLSTLAVNLGSSVDVVIDGAATFKWRVNGGAYTTAVPITTTGVSIPGATLYFLTSAAIFNVGDTWSWQRTDCTFEYNSTKISGEPMVSTTHRKDVYYVNPNGRIMKQTRDQSSATGVPYIISVGYFPVYGRGVSSFFDHLYVIGFYSDESGATPASVAAINTSLSSANSDLNDYDNFFSTDTNEADLYTIPDETENGESSTNLVCSFVWNARLYIISDRRAYVNDYIGLPNVNDYKEFDTIELGFQDSATRQCGYAIIAATISKVYIVGRNRVFLFAGSFVDISAPLNGTGLVFYSGHFNNTRQELLVRTGSNTLLTYNDITRSWYERYTGFGSATNGCTGILELAGEMLLGTTSLRYLREDITGVSTPVADSSNGTAFGTPTLVTQMLRGVSFQAQKEIFGAFVPFAYSPLGANYSVNGNAKLSWKWSVNTTGVASATPTLTGDSSSFALGTTTKYLISYPRLPFNGLHLAIELSGLDGSKPPGRFYLSEIDLELRNYTQPLPSR